MQSHFRTLLQPSSLTGVGLHTGVPVDVRLLPSHRPGIFFVRTDLSGEPEVVASLRNVSQTTHATTLSHDGISLSTTEHLLAALWANGITHCRIEVNGPEIPILDGSATQWQNLIESSGFQELPGERPVYTLREPVEVRVGEACVVGVPLPDTFRVSVDVEYGRSYLGNQEFESIVTPAIWRDELAGARTFTLEEWIEPLRSQGLIKGGSPDNAVILFRDHASSPLRFKTEMARHKALDLIGDIALLFGENGGILHTHLTAIRAGHELHRQWMAECLKRDALVSVNPNN